MEGRVVQQREMASGGLSTAPSKIGAKFRHCSDEHSLLTKHERFTCVRDACVAVHAAVLCHLTVAGASDSCTDWNMQQLDSVQSRHKRSARDIYHIKLAASSHDVQSGSECQESCLGGGRDGVAAGVGTGCSESKI